MSSPDLETETTKLEKYLLREGRKEFVEEIRAASPSTLDAKLLSLAKHREEITNGKASDGDLKKAKETARTLGEVYSRQLRMNAKLSRFVALIMQEQGMIDEGMSSDQSEEE